jgi:hypothetical protein
VNKDELEQLLIKLAPLLDEYLNPERERDDKGRILPRRHGFLLCAFEFGEKGALAFIANAQPADLHKALQELATKLDATARRIKQ